ncbi:MAG: 2-oxo acid dehydrogenase subunit E2 [Thermogutta sp.]|nr:2-oxo acid dehydrogenase subunit E2 [Thermogutta sp.]HPU06216.1 2-oxo acid dehydrogenase subunit E2 [Thermogutta sp.]HQF13667.1 2-oxo acid dehydrogenase subunit E2 [Thermogutta sp.]
MPIEFALPNLGENVTSGDVINVLVKEGDVIVGNQAVIELETDKAVVEIPCPYGGQVKKVLVKKGDTVKVGQTILIVESEVAEKAPVVSPAKGPESQVAAAPPEEKPSPPPAAPTPPPVAAVTAATTATAVAPEPSPLVEVDSRLLPAGPAARRLARELGVNLATVQGTGRHGRITVEDVQRAAQSRAEAPRVTIPSPVVPPGEPGQDSWGPIRREKMSKIRKTIAAQMTRSWTTIPRVTNFDDADVTDLENLRKSVPPDFLGEGLKLTFMPFVMRAVSLALRHHPLLNASLDEENEQIIYKEYINLGIAVDTPRGLVVPVVRNADQMTIPQLARALSEVARKARNVEFTVDELRGGTFTISNLGAVGGTYSTPIINYPEVAILLLGRSRWLPVVRDGQIVARYMMPLSLSYDHRLVDGAAAARFLNEIIDWLQNPGKLLLVS